MFSFLGKFAGAGVKLVPYIGLAINTIEIVSGLITGLKGEDKKKAVLEAVTKALPVVEGALEKDVVNDPKVVEALKSYIDAYVSLQNAIKATQESKGSQL
jgi:hypothetical protein